MSKHSTGPWAVRFDEATTIRDGQGNQLAICTYLKTVTGGRRDGNEVEANGRLLAAAPDLIETLYEIRALAHDDIADPNDHAVRSRIVAMARDAIKKATGEQ